MHLVLPKEMSFNNLILGFCPLPNQAQVNCEGAMQECNVVGSTFQDQQKFVALKKHSQ